MTAMAQPAEPTEPASTEPGQKEPVAESAERERAERSESGWSGSLPDAVRLRVVGLASDALGALADDEVPSSLKPFHRWAPARRTKLAATPLAAAIEHDVLFRQRCAARLREAMPDLAAALEAGTLPAAADPVDVAAAAYLLRPADWGSRIAEAAEQLTQATAASGTAEAAEMLARLQEKLAAARTQAREELARSREETAAAQAETAAVTRELRAEKGARRRAESAAEESDVRAREAGEAAAAATSAAETELRRMRARLAETESALESARRATRGGRSAEDTRLRLLLDTVVDASQGLRRELALPPTTDRPADLVEAAAPGSASVGSSQPLLADDPAVFDELLALPQVHVIVDGYNVTKTGYPDLPLEQQRSRLVAGLVALVARSGAEVTCCFDGATVGGHIPSMSRRGVRVLFSKPGEIADELIRRLVRAEPQGRPVVVVSSDREVADGVRRHGARPVTSAALVRRLDRG